MRNKLISFAQTIANIAQKPITPCMAHQSPYIISFGYFWIHSSLNASQDSEKYLFHPLFAQESSCNNHCFRYEVGTELGVAWLIIYFLLNKDFFQQTQQPSTASHIKQILDDLDIGFLASESNLGEEELQILSEIPKNSDMTLILGEELAMHDEAIEIAHIIGTLAQYLNIHIVIPTLETTITPNAHCSNIVFAPCESLPESNGNVIYIVPTETQPYILQTPLLFAPQNKLYDLQPIILKSHTQSFEACAKIDSHLKGTIGILYLPQESYQQVGYPYQKVEVIAR